jgi:hypothetical protein
LNQSGFFTLKSLQRSSVKVVLFFNLLHSTSLIGQVESFNLSMMNDGDLQQMLSKISSSEKFDDYEGSPYLFKEKAKGIIFLGDNESVSFPVTFNLDFLSMKFVIYNNEDETYLLDSSEVTSFKSGEFAYIRNNEGQFIKIIFKEDDFTLFEKYHVEIEDQDYVVGYEKPSKKYVKVKNSMFIDDNGNLIPFKPKLKFLHSQFNMNIKTLKNFIKKSSLKLKNHKDLKTIFEEFNKK